jgi:hypothetical protein
MVKTTSGRRFMIRADDDCSTDTSQLLKRSAQPSYSLFPRSPNVQRQTKVTPEHGVPSPISPSSGELSPASPNGVTINVYRSKSVKSSTEKRPAPKRHLIKHKPTLSAPSELAHCREGSACTYDSVLQKRYPGRQVIGNAPVTGVKSGREPTEHRGYSRYNSVLSSKPLPPIKQEEQTKRAPAAPSSLEARPTSPDQTLSPRSGRIFDEVVNVAVTGTSKGGVRKALQASANTSGGMTETPKCPMPGCGKVLRKGSDLCRACAREFRPHDSVFYPTSAAIPKTPMSAPLMYAVPEEEEEEEEEEKEGRGQEERKGVLMKEEAAGFGVETDRNADSIDRLSSRFNSHFRLQPAPPGKTSGTRRGPFLTNNAQSATPDEAEGAAHGTITHGCGEYPSTHKHISFQIVPSATRHPRKNSNTAFKPPASAPTRYRNLRQHHDTLERRKEEARHESKDVDQMIEKLIRLYDYKEDAEADEERSASRDVAPRKGTHETTTSPEQPCGTPEDVVEIPAIGKVRREWVSEQGVRVVSIGLVELASWSPVYRIESWI